MKQFALISIVIFLSCVSLFGQKTGGAAKTDPAKGVRDAFDRLTEGIRQVDVEKLMSVYDNNERTLFFNNNGSVTMGWAQMKENRTSSFAKTKNVTLETTGVRVEMLSPTSAYVSFKWKQTQEYDGKLESATGRTTIVFKKIGKDWKAVHLHTSPDNVPPTRPLLDSERENPETK
ncbi:MAG TPA: nuclear transport factor 2 family protein [Pyrinomonadaceae bacterium]